MAYLEPLPDRLRDDDVADLRRTVLRARAAYGPKDSIRDALPEEVTEPFLDALDRLLKALAQREVGGLAGRPAALPGSRATRRRGSTS